MKNEKDESVEETSLPTEEITSDSEGYTVDTSVTKDDWVEFKKKLIQAAERGLIIFGVVALLAMVVFKLFITNLPEKIAYTESLTYAEVRGGYAVTGYTPQDGDTFGSVDIMIPPQYNGKPVVEIAGHAFYNDDHIKTVTIPEGVVSIGELAFLNCQSLTSITLPASAPMFASST